MGVAVESRFGSCGIDGRGDLGDSVCGETALGGVFPDQGLVGRDVNTVDFILGYIAVNPLNLGSEFAQNAAGGLGDGLKLLGAELSSAGQVALDHIFWH